KVLCLQLRLVRMHCQLPCKQNGDKAFRRVEQKCHRTQPLAAGADHIRSANVAAALLTDVLLAEDAYQDEPEGNRAEQIRDDAGDEVEQHRNGFECSAFHINCRRTRSSAACALSIRTRSRVFWVENGAKFFCTTSVSVPLATAM